MNPLHTAATENGWGQTELLARLDTFLKDKGLSDEFHQVLVDESKVGDKPFGHEAALATLAEDDSFRLYKCEIGLFAYVDPSTPIDIKTALIASDDAGSCNIQALSLIEESVPVTSGLMFSPVSMPVQVSSTDY